MDWIFEHLKYIQISSFKFLTILEHVQKLHKNFQNFWSYNYFPINFQSFSTIQNLENIKTHCSLPLLSLTAWAHSSATQTEDTAVLPSPVGQNAPAVMLRRGGPHLYDLPYPTNLSQPSERQQAHRRELHAGHGGVGTTEQDVTMVTMQ